MKHLVLLLSALLVVMGARAQEAQKREMRTVWVATVSNIDWPQSRGTGSSMITKQKKQLTDMLDGFAKTNMNGICLQVRPMADALYHSSYEPWSSYLTGTRGQDPGWDPLAFAVEECHKRGLECHAWVNPYRFSNSGGRDCNTAIDQAVKNSGMLMQVGDRVVFNPALEASRQHLLKVCREMIENYDIDGIIFDDYFYPGDGTPTNSSAPDYTLWQQSGTTMSIADWRRENVNTMVREMYNMVQEVKPYVKFAIGPAGVAGTAATSAGKHHVTPCPTGSDWQYNQIYSDPLAWLEEGTIDYISPQLYWKTNHSTNPFGPLTQWWSYIANHFHRHHYASHNIYFMASTNTESDWAEVAQQIQYSRDYNLDNAPGVNFYSAKYINGPTCTGLGDYIREHLFTHKALIPCMDWKPKTVFAAPANFENANGVLSWTGTGVSLIRYAVYAIPFSVPFSDITSDKFGGIKSDYLVNVTYESTFTLPDEYKSGYWYAVTVVDGWGNEFEPAYINAPTDPVPAPQLIAPVDSVVTEWEQEFSWSAVEGATFTLQIATDETFSDIVMTKPAIEENTITLDLGELAPETTYHWRIVTSAPGFISSTSMAATFTTPAHGIAPVAQLITPLDGAELDDNFQCAFTVDEEVDAILQIATDNDFQNIVYSTEQFNNEAEAKTCEILVSVIGKGAFFWRVVTSARYCDDSVSDVRSFTVTKIPIGEFEPGYVIKKDVDADEYEMVDGLKLRSNWFRSVKEEYDNMSFDNDGLLNRGFTVLNGKVYVSGRTENSTNGGIYLAEYSAETGEHLRDITLPDEVNVGYLPCNDVMTDDAGHLIVANMVLNIGSAPIKLFVIDPETGDATLRASLTASVNSKPRIDHVNILGDIVGGDFCVFAATASGTELIRWSFANGALDETLVTNVTGFSPSSSTHFGIAPRVLPISEDFVLVKGGNIHLTRYDIYSGNIDESFASGSEFIAPSNTQGNGMASFLFLDKEFLFYSYGDFNSAEGQRYILAMNPDGDHFNDYQKLWTLPMQGIGRVNSQTWGAPCVAVPSEANQNIVDLFIYVPGNGLASYSLINTAILGDVNHDLIVNVTDINIIVSAILNNISVTDFPEYDLNGDGHINVSDVNICVSLVLSAVY